MPGGIFEWLGLSSSSASREDEAVRPLPDMLSSSGRVSYAYLQRLVREMPAEEFIDYLKGPLLTGWGIQEGTLDAAADPLSGVRGKTLYFKPAQMLAFRRSVAAESEPLKQAIYPLVRTRGSSGKEVGVFSIGRETGNDIVISDFAVSKKHARIEKSSGGYFLFDLGSKNGTAVNGFALGKNSIELRNKSVIRFARYEFTFVFPDTLYVMLKPKNLLKGQR